MSAKKIAVAMSGGVDSTVTAALLQKQGYEILGVFMALAQPDLAGQIARVQKAADFLGVPLEVVDLGTEFKQEVLGYFRTAYEAGKTPNPCVICNRRIKFGRLLDRAQARGCRKMATGHYARIKQAQNGVFHLLRGRDPKKDQSYFLNMLTQEQLAGILFPLGEYEKDHVYAVAEDFGLLFERREESQDVCFLADTDIATCLAQLGVPARAGDIVTADGTRVGRHKGVAAYTVGQRRGLGVPDATPYYVIGLDSRTNRIIVGKEGDLQARGLLVRNVNWTVGTKPVLPGNFDVKIRYRHMGAKATVREIAGGEIEIDFLQPQRAVTPGQFAVFYDNDEVVGGGEIVSACK